LGTERAQGTAPTLEAALRSAGFAAEVSVASDYQAMTRALEHGEALAAWGPPVVCAWTEAFGGRGLARCVRQGFGTYRAALVARRGEAVDLGAPGLRAAWVDRDSMAGYVLPQAMLRERGLRPSRHFAQVSFLGSYDAVLAAVLDRQADLTSVWASPDHARPARDGVQALAGARQGELEIIAYSRECPNDGVVAGPKLSADDQAALQQAVLALDESDEGQRVIREVFLAERLEASPPGSYRELHETVFKALAG
jgi:phosphonate transport system substrate-binding protein